MILIVAMKRIELGSQNQFRRHTVLPNKGINTFFVLILPFAMSSNSGNIFHACFLFLHIYSHFHGLKI